MGEGWGEGFTHNDKYEPRPCGCNTRKLVNNRFPARKGWGLRSGNPQSLLKVKNLTTYRLNVLKTSKKIAFTLAEVLITLGVIGIVAAMTIPTLVNNYQEKVFIVKLKQSYSIFSQALKLATAENGSVTSWDIGTFNGDNAAVTMEGSVKLYNILSAYLRKSKSCADEIGCFAENYLTLDGGEYYRGFQPKTNNMYAKGILANGTSFAIASFGSGCNSIFPKGYDKSCGAIYVDLNSYKGPNQAGVDYFGFFITSKGLQPIGLPEFDGEINNYVCLYNQYKNGNGVGCTAWVLAKGNMDYRRKDITNEWFKQNKQE